MMSWRSIFGLFVVFQVYLIIGMVAFHFLESDTEDIIRRDTRAYKKNILANFTCMTSENLESLISVLSYAISNGVDPSNNATSPPNWEYNGAYFFSGTVITTIGYGHISPNTRAGQSFCIVFALVGIPICGILLSALGDKFCKFKDGLLERVNQEFRKQWQRKAFNVFITVGVGMIIFIIIPATIFAAIEGWQYHEAWYYCFVTLTTIGFGDFVAGQNPNINYPAIYKIMTFYWILIGLVYLATIIQDISNAISSSVEKIQERSEKARLKGDDNIVIKGHETGVSNTNANNGEKENGEYGPTEHNTSLNKIGT